MSKKNKYPVPEDDTERFMSVVYVLADSMGIKKIPEVYDYVELMGEAVARHVFEKNHQMSPQKKVHKDKQTFVAIFKRRYAQLLDLEYTKRITPAEMKMIHQANKFIFEQKFTLDDFHEWLFDTFLPDNPKFSPPTIKSVCSQFVLHTFVAENQERREANRRKELDKKAGMLLIQRTRGLMRKEDILEDDKDTLKKCLKDYGERKIALSELRKTVEAFEGKYDR